MATNKSDLALLQKAHSIFNIFAHCSIQMPKTELCRAVFAREPAIQQELAMLVRLAKLRPEDQRRNLLPMSLHEAKKHIVAFYNAALSVGGPRVSDLKEDRSTIEMFKALPTKLGKMKTLFSEVAKKDTSTAKIEDLWLQRVFAVEEMIDASVLVNGSFDGQSRDQFSRTIIFEPEYRQAGISILSYFSEILDSKYPGSDVRVRIEQAGSKVTLHVETPTGEIEKFERELSQYGLAVTRQLPISEYLPDRLGAIRLEQKIQMAEMEARHTRELLASERANHASQITLLRSEIDFVRAMLDKTQYEASQVSVALRSVALGAGSSIGEAINRLIAALIESESSDKAARLEQELQNIAHESPGIIDRISQLLIVGSVQGAAGNYLYAALQAVQKMM